MFFKLLAFVLGKDRDVSSLDTLMELSSRCLEAAKCNMRILTGLYNINRIGEPTKLSR